VVHPKAIAAIQELGYELHQHFSKGLSAVPAVEYDVAVTMSCEDNCHVVKAKHREDWSIPMPKEMPPDQFRRVWDEIKEKVKELLKRLDHGAELGRPHQVSETDCVQTGVGHE
jgi:protein-tyrosine-phosphatase